MLEQGEIDLIAAEFTIEIRHRKYDLITEMRGLMAVNGFHFDAPVIKEFQQELQRKTARIFKKYSQWAPYLEDIISFWECYKIDLDNDEAMDDYVSSVTSLFIQTFRKRNETSVDELSTRVMKYINEGHLDSSKENPDRRRFVDFTKICAYSIVSHLVNVTQEDFQKYYAANANSSNKFLSNISKEQRENLYHKISRKDLIKDTVTHEDFEAVMTQVWGSHSSRIIFNINLAEISVLISQLVLYFPGLNPSSVERSGHFYTQENTPIKASGIYTAKNQYPSSFEFDKMIKDHIKP